MLADDILLQNRYRIRRQIGRGSMGAVYQASDLRLDNDVAVKQIMRRGWQMRRAFAQEARLLARLRHPALPKVIDYFSDETGHFLVMEFIPGDDLGLAALKRLEPFPGAQVVAWGRQLLRVLAYLHGRHPPILHGDIKPANLKLNERGEIILLDFGLARGGTAWPASDDVITGYSRYYAPPEQMQGRGADARSDLYALAATLYDLATGVKPPDAGQQRLAAQAARRPDPLLPAHEIEPMIPAAVSAVWQRALALLPDERFASAPDMLLALETAVPSETAVPHNLPAQATPLVGRRPEIREARQCLLAEGARLLTLTGPGGVGKTRLCLHIAAVLRDSFADGVFFVPLASLRDPGLVLAAVAHAVGVQESGRKSGSKSLWEAVQERLRDKQMLLLLDNFEHLLAAALLVADLLATGSRLKVIVTSREALHLRGEHEFPVSPLALPEAGQPALAEAWQYTAVQLFGQRARAANPGFVLDEGSVTAVTEICQRLDGLPQAIELAAARLKTLSPAQILERLAHRFDLLQDGPRDLPARQQALRATLDWSYDLLSPAEQRLFRRLAVFVGGWTLATAVAICQPAGDDDLPPLAVEDGLASLVDKNLVQRQPDAHDEPRYAMLVTVQAYAAERLAESGERNALQKRHADYYLDWAENVRPALLGPKPEISLSQLELEHDNLRTVLHWSLISHNEEAGFRLGDAIWRYWEARGYYTEGRQWLDRLLAQSDKPSMARAKALSAAGNLARDQGEHERAATFHEESLVLCRKLGDKRWEGVELNNLALVWFVLGDYERVKRWLEASLTLSREVENTNGIGHTLNNLGVLAMRQGKYQQAEGSLQESLATFHSLADKRAICLPLNNLGELANYQGKHEQATALLTEAHLLAEELGDKWLLAHTLRNMGKVARNKGNSEQAASWLVDSLNFFREFENSEGIATLLNLLGKVAHDSEDDERAKALSEEGLTLCRQINDNSGTAVALQNLAVISLHQGNYNTAAAQYRQALTLFSQVNHRLDMVACLEGMAGVANGQGQAARAARLLGAADVLRTGMGAPLPPVDWPGHERLLTAVRAALGEDAFAAAWAEGQGMGWETAVSYALEA